MSDLQFFGAEGLTSTSANHIANLAKERVQDLEKDLRNLSLVQKEVALIGAGEYHVIQHGFTDEQVNDMPGTLMEIAGMKSLIAWLREAIKEREAMRVKLGSMDLDEYCALMGKTRMPQPQRREAITKEQVIEGMSIKDRNKMFTLQTVAAVIGQYIHPDGKFSTARRELADKSVNNYQVQGEGRDTLLYKYTPSCSSEVVEDTFFKLQKKHREVQAELNGMLHAIEETVMQDKAASMSEYSKQLAIYNAEEKELLADFQSYKIAENERISSLKIVIPNALKDVYEMVVSLGK